MKVTVTKNLNVRVGKPSVNAPCYQYIAPGSELEVDGILYAGDFFNNSNKWMKDAASNYYWAGGLNLVTSNEQELTSVFFNYNSLFQNIPKTICDSNGKEIKVTVLDSGVYEQHPDLFLAFNNNTSVDFTNSLSGATDRNGHGTHVTGLIGARSNDKIGIVGVAPECTLRNIKVIADTGDSSGMALLMGLKEAKRLAVDIINLSLSITFNQYKGIQNAFPDFAKDTIIVAAAGNDETLMKADMLFPAMSPHVISVGAISKDFVRKNPSPTFNKRLDYILPEISLTSCWIKEKSFYGEDLGSSMSAALLTGLVALIMRATGNKSLTNVKHELDGIAVKYSQQIDLDSITLIKPI